MGNLSIRAPGTQEADRDATSDLRAGGGGGKHGHEEGEKKPRWKGKSEKETTGEGRAG